MDGGTRQFCHHFLSESLKRSGFGTLPWANAMRSQRDREANAARLCYVACTGVMSARLEQKREHLLDGVVESAYRRYSGVTDDHSESVIALATERITPPNRSVSAK